MNSNDKNKSINIIIGELFEEFESMIIDPSISQSEALKKLSEQYIDFRLSSNQDKQSLKTEISNVLANLYKNSHHLNTKHSLVGRALNKKTRFDRNMEYYQRRLESRNKNRPKRRISDFSDKQKLNIFLNYLSKIIARHEFNTDQSRISISLRKTEFDAETFNALNIKDAKSSTYSDGIVKSTFFINQFFKTTINVKTDTNKDSIVDNDGLLKEKWQNKRWYTTSKSYGDNESYLDANYFGTLPMALLFEEMLGLTPQNDRSIFDFENSSMNDEHIIFKDGIVLDGYSDFNKDEWNKILLPSEHLLIKGLSGVKALILESIGQRGGQYLSDHNSKWRDVLIFNKDVMTFRSLTDDSQYSPSVNVPVLSEEWYMSNNMPEIPYQCMSEFIFYFIDRWICSNHGSSHIEDQFLEFYTKEHVAKCLKVSMDDLEKMIKGELPKRGSIFEY